MDAAIDYPGPGGALQFVTLSDQMVVIGSARERRGIAIVEGIEPKPIVPSPNYRAVVWIVVGSHNVPYPKRPDIDRVVIFSCH